MMHYLMSVEPVIMILKMIVLRIALVAGVEVLVAEALVEVALVAAPVAEVGRVAVGSRP